MDKIKKILKENKIIVVIILISLFFVYFWGVRPSQIRKLCSTYRISNEGEPSEYRYKVTNIGNDEYKSCLRRHGIEN